MMLSAARARKLCRRDEAEIAYVMWGTGSSAANMGRGKYASEGEL